MLIIYFHVSVKLPEANDLAKRPEQGIPSVK